MNPTADPRPRVWKGRNIVLWTVFGCLGVFVLLALFSDINRLENAFEELDPWILLPVGLLSLGNYGLRYVKWQAYLRRMGHRVAPWPSALVFMSGFALTVTPGKVGEFVKAYILKERNGVPYTASMAVLLVERLTDVAAIVLLSCLGLFSEILSPGVAILAVAGMGAVVVLLRNRTLIGFLIRATEKVRPLRRFSTHLHDLYENGWSLLSPGILSWTMALSVVAWFFEGLGYFLVADAFGVKMSLLVAVFVYSASLLGGVLTIFIGGLGATEGGLVALGVLHGMDMDVSIAAALLIRLMTLWFAVVIGWIVFALTPGFRSLLAESRQAEEGRKDQTNPPSPAQK